MDTRRFNKGTFKLKNLWDTIVGWLKSSKKKESEVDVKKEKKSTVHVKVTKTQEGKYHVTTDKEITKKELQKIRRVAE